MILTLNNIGKVQSAPLVLEGITAIIGDNNMGKSTAGKALYSLLAAFNGLDGGIHDSRVKYVAEGAKVPNVARASRVLSPNDFTDASKLDVATLAARLQRYGALRSLTPIDAVHRYDSEGDAKMFAERMMDYIEKAKTIPYNDLVHDVVTESFNRYFNGQFLPNFIGFSEESEVGLEVDGKTVSLKWNDGPEPTRLEFRPTFDAWFVGSPLVLDSLAEGSVRPGSRGMRLDAVHNDLVMRLRRGARGAWVSRRVAGNELAPVMEMLTQKLPGRFDALKDGKLGYKTPGMGDPLHAGNLSMGLKVFSVLKLMIEENLLKPGDVLVLDEPENHLHPEYQLVFANVIVLLQRIYKLSVLLTTHSPYFLQAVELYARKYRQETASGTELRVYEPKVSDLKFGRVTLTEVTGDTSQMYRKFAMGFRNLDQLRSDLASEGGACDG